MVCEELVRKIRNLECLNYFKQRDLPLKDTHTHTHTNPTQKVKSENKKSCPIGSFVSFSTFILTTWMKTSLCNLHLTDATDSEGDITI